MIFRAVVGELPAQGEPWMFSPTRPQAAGADSVFGAGKQVRLGEKKPIIGAFSYCIEWGDWVKWLLE